MHLDSSLRAQEPAAAEPSQMPFPLAGRHFLTGLPRVLLANFQPPYKPQLGRFPPSSSILAPPTAPRQSCFPFPRRPLLIPGLPLSRCFAWCAPRPLHPPGAGRPGHLKSNSEKERGFWNEGGLGSRTRSIPSYLSPAASPSLSRLPASQRGITLRLLGGFARRCMRGDRPVTLTQIR